MGRHCGWLTAATARYYKQRLNNKRFYDKNGLYKKCWDIHAIYIPELEINIQNESERLSNVMDSYDCVNIFLSEGAGIDNIVKDLESSGEAVNRDAFGHVRLDEINPGQWYARKIAQWTDAKKVLVQKSGYFARSAAPNKNDISLINRISEKAVGYALDKRSGVVALSDKFNQEIKCIEFKDIKGGKPFDYNQDWYKNMLIGIGQKKG